MACLDELFKIGDSVGDREVRFCRIVAFRFAAEGATLMERPFTVRKEKVALF